MKIYRNYNDLPENAAYLGGTSPDGCLDECTADAVDQAINPVCLRDDDGSQHYFELATALN